MPSEKMVQLSISIEAKLIEEVKKLNTYKSAADEALSYALENSDDEKIRKLCLKALNIGAHKQGV